ncbi:hypothetical protein AD998_13275 [bacterium 336/3]|nr:hypothetical protein AD998_13275 [bacterium 336/3]
MKKLLLSLLLILFYLPAFAQPQGNRGLFFDGTDDHITINTLPDVDGNFTIEAWVKIYEPINFGQIFSILDKNDGVSGYSFYIRENTGNAQIVLWMNAGTGSSFSNNIPMGNFADKKWHHIAVTRAGVGSAINFYLDGVNVGNIPVNNINILPVTTTAYIGKRGTSFFKGQIDEVRFFTTQERSAGQISTDKDAVGNLGAEFYWAFEEGQNQTAGNTGTSGVSGDGALGTSISPDIGDPLWALRVKNTTDSGLESLRDVITNANTLVGTNYIDFSIQQANPATVSTIILTTTATNGVIDISEPVIIDGYSAFGASKNSNVALANGTNAQIRIELDFSNIPDRDGLRLEGAGASGSQIKGLSIYGAGLAQTVTRAGIYSSTASNVIVEGCFIGTNANGVAVTGKANSNGIAIQFASNAVIGGTTTASANLISNQSNDGGIFLTFATNTIIQNNLIGTNPAGTGAVPNNRAIYVGASGANILNNVISGNLTGITVATSNGNTTNIKGNLIGTVANGSSGLPNTTGIDINLVTTNTMIGGIGAGDGNIIAHNLGSGIVVNGTDADNNTISRNSIYANVGSGISLINAGNNNKPAPTITSATPTIITGTCTSCANLEIVEVFDNPPAESQGRTFLGIATVNAGVWSFAGTFTLGNNITATITDAAGNTSAFSAPVVIAPPSTNFFTLGDTNWNSNANWSSDGSTLCGCRPQGVTGATIVIRSGHTATLSNNADLGTNNTINIQDPLSTLEVTASISTPIQTLNGQAGTRILMRVFTFPPITTNTFATTNGTTIEFGANSAGTIPNQFNGNNYKSLAINGSGGVKNAGGNILVQEDFSLLGGDVFHVGGDDFTVDGITTIAPSSMFIDNATGGINTFNGVINNDGVLSAIGAGGNVSTFNFNNDVINSPTGTLNLDCNCQYNFNKAVAPPLLLQPGLAMIFGSNGGGSGNIFSDLTIGDGALVTFNVTNVAQLLIANNRTVNNNNFTSGVMMNGNGAINGANASSRWNQGNNAQLYYNSDVPIMNTGIFDASTNPNTIFYSRAGDQVVKGTTYHSVAFGGSGLRNVTTGNFTINTNFTIPSGITFQINGNNFTANGAVTIVGVFNDSGSGGTNTFNDIVQVNTGGTFAVIGANTTGFIFKGNITNQGTFSLINSTQWVLDADLSIQNQSASPMTFSDISSGLGTINGNITVLDFAGGGNVIFNGNGGVLLNGTLNNQLGDYPTATRFLRISKLNGSGTLTNATNAVIDYRDDQASTANFNLLAPDNLFVYSFGNATMKSTTYHHLKIIGTGTKTLSGDITVNGNLEIVLGASLNTTTSNHDIDMKGDWLGNGTFIPNNSIVTFSGISGVQSITASGLAPFNQMNINNSGNVSLNTPVTATSISLTQGKLILKGNDFTLNAIPATDQITQSFTNTSTSYIVTDGIGRLIRNSLQVGTVYDFPIGEISSIRHISITPATAGNMAAKFEAPLTPLPPLSFTDVAVGSWSLSGLGGSVTFFNSGCISTNSKVYRLNGAVWDITGITTTVALPSYTATALNFATLERYTIFGTAPLVINPTTLPNGQVGIGYLQTPFSVVAGLPPFTFSLNSGILPDGLSLDGDELTGFPTTAGSYTFTIGASDNAGNTGERVYTLVIDRGQQFVQSYSSVLLPDGKYELNATFDSGLPASFISTNREVATIQGNILTLTSQIFDGETDILAFQAGDGNFQASDSVLVLRINNFGLTTGLNDLEKNTKIYPNPATEKVSVTTTKNSIEIQRIELLNLMGNILKTSYPISQDSVSIPLENISSGIYLLKITTNQGIFLKRITKL